MSNPVSEVTVRRQTGVQRKKQAKAARKWKRLRGSRRPKRLTAKQKAAVRKRKGTGFYKKIARLRSSLDLPATITGSISHRPEYIDAVLEAAAELDAEKQDARAFAKLFIDKDPAFSNTDTGMAAILFEAFIFEKGEDIVQQFLETQLEGPDTTFLAIFEGKIEDEALQKLTLGVRDICTIDPLVRAGDTNHEEGIISDVTILECTPKRQKKSKAATQPEPTLRTEGLLPQTKADYEAVLEEGGLSDNAFMYLYPAVWESAKGNNGDIRTATEPTGITWYCHEGVWLPDIESLDEQDIDEAQGPKSRKVGGIKLTFKEHGLADYGQKALRDRLKQFKHGWNVVLDLVDPQGEVGHVTLTVEGGKLIVSGRDPKNLRRTLKEPRPVKGPLTVVYAPATKGLGTPGQYESLDEAVTWWGAKNIALRKGELWRVQLQADSMKEIHAAAKALKALGKYKPIWWMGGVLSVTVSKGAPPGLTAEIVTMKKSARDLEGILKKHIPGFSTKGKIESIGEYPDDYDELDEAQKFKTAEQVRDHFFDKKEGYKIKIAGHTLTVVAASVRGSPPTLRWIGKKKGKGFVSDFLNAVDPNDKKFPSGGRSESIHEARATRAVTVIFDLDHDDYEHESEGDVAKLARQYKGKTVEDTTGGKEATETFLFKDVGTAKKFISVLKKKRMAGVSTVYDDPEQYESVTEAFTATFPDTARANRFARECRTHARTIRPKGLNVYYEAREADHTEEETHQEAIDELCKKHGGKKRKSLKEEGDSHDIVAGPFSGDGEPRLIHNGHCEVLGFQAPLQSGSLYLENEEGFQSKFLSWTIRKEGTDDGKILVHVKDATYRLPITLQEVKGLLDKMEEFYEDLPDEFDAMVQAYFQEYAEANGEALCHEDIVSLGLQEAQEEWSTHEFTTDRDARISAKCRLRRLALGEDLDIVSTLQEAGKDWSKVSNKELRKFAGSQRPSMGRTQASWDRGFIDAKAKHKLADPYDRYYVLGYKTAKGTLSEDDIAEADIDDVRGGRAAFRGTRFMCNECGEHWRTRAGPTTFAMKCPKCGSYDTGPSEDLDTMSSVEEAKKYAIRTEKGEKASVLQAIRKRDRTAKVDPEGNPTTAWVTTKLSVKALRAMDGVEDAVETTSITGFGEDTCTVEIVPRQVMREGDETTRNFLVIDGKDTGEIDEATMSTMVPYFQAAGLGTLKVGEKATTRVVKCPECGGKVLKATGYCVTCKKKTIKEDDYEVDEQVMREKRLAEIMQSRGYTHAVIPKKGEGEPLYAKTMKLARLMLTEFPGGKIVPIEKLSKAKGESIEEARVTYMVSVHKGQKGRVLRMIREQDRTMHLHPDSPRNPLAAWVTTNLDSYELEEIDGVERATRSHAQESIDEAKVYFVVTALKPKGHKITPATTKDDAFKTAKKQGGKVVLATSAKDATKRVKAGEYVLEDDLDEAKFGLTLEKIRLSGEYQAFKVLKGKSLVGFLMQTGKNTATEEHPWKAFRVAQRGQVGEKIGFYYKKDGGKSAALQAIARTGLESEDDDEPIEEQLYMGGGVEIILPKGSKDYASLTKVEIDVDNKTTATATRAKDARKWTLKFHRGSTSAEKKKAEKALADFHMKYVESITTIDGVEIDEAIKYVYAKLVPTTDKEVPTKQDTAIFSDKEGKKEIARFPWHYKRKPGKKARVVVINGQMRKLVWIGEDIDEVLRFKTSRDIERANAFRVTVQAGNKTEGLAFRKALGKTTAGRAKAIIYEYTGSPTLVQFVLVGLMKNEKVVSDWLSRDAGLDFEFKVEENYKITQLEGEALDEARAGALTMRMKGVGKVTEPTHMRALAKRAGKSAKAALKLWGKAQAAANKQYPELKSAKGKGGEKERRYYKVVTAIFKNMLGLGKEEAEQCGPIIAEVLCHSCRSTTEVFMYCWTEAVCGECQSVHITPTGELHYATEEECEAADPALLEAGYTYKGKKGKQAQAWNAAFVKAAEKLKSGSTKKSADWIDDATYMRNSGLSPEVAAKKWLSVREE